MHSAWDPFIGYMFAVYIILSIASITFQLGYAVYWIVKKIKQKRRKENNT